MVGRLLLLDALRTDFQPLRLARDPACRVCGESSGHSQPSPIRPGQ